MTTEPSEPATNPAGPGRPGWVRWALAGLAIAIVAGSASVWVDDPRMAGALVIAGVCLSLWLSEAVPPYVPTLLLWP